MVINTASISLSDTSLKSNETATVTISFSQPVGSLPLSALSAPNGSLSTPQTSDGGLTWTSQFTPGTNVTAANNVITLDQSVTGAASNTSSTNFSIDTLAPTVTISMSDTSLVTGETSVVTIHFSEQVSAMNAGRVSADNGTLSAFTTSNGGLTWTSVFTPTAGILSDIFTPSFIRLDTAGLTDLAGNATAGVTNISGYYTVDTRVSPSATIALSDTALDIDDSASVTITFNEAVAGLGSEDLSVQGGTLSNPVSADGGLTWTASFTPTKNTESAVNLITLQQSGVTGIASGLAGTGAASSPQYAVDTKAPTVTVSLSDTSLKIGETAQVTLGFSERVTGVEVSDLTVTNAKLDGLASSDGGLTWTGVLTPMDGLNYKTGSLTLNQAGVADLAGNAGIGNTKAVYFGVDTLRPTATISLGDNALGVGETSKVTITFSESVSGFDLSDLGAPNGKLGPIVSHDEGMTYSTTFTPATGVSSASNVVTLDLAGIADWTGNAGAATASSANYSVHTQAPGATIGMGDSVLTSGETAQVTIGFTEAVSGLAFDDFNVEGGTLSNLVSADGGLNWTASFTPSKDTESAVNHITLKNGGVTGVVSGLAGAGTASSPQYAVDTKAPTATVSLSDTSLKIGETAQVTLSFSERVTGVEASDLTVPNGKLGALASSDGGLTWTGVLTPADGSKFASHPLTLNLAGVTDLAGNAGIGNTKAVYYYVDTLRPTATISLADTTLTPGETSKVTITFSESVSGFDLSDLSAANGKLGTLVSHDEGMTYSTTFTPATGVSSANNAVTLDLAGIADWAGNAGAGSSSSANYSVYTQPPSATIGMADKSLAIGESAQVTIGFTEAVSGLAADDFSVEGGTLSTLASTDGGLNWSASFTPTKDIESAVNHITLKNGGVTGVVSGLAGAGTATSPQYAVDTRAPTATLSLSDKSLKIGETAQVTVSFSERVTGLDASDLALANGKLGALASGDGGLTWTGVFTPADGQAFTSGAMTLDLAGVADLAGNAGTGSTKAGYQVDTLRPTATIALADSTLTEGETTEVTITFSESVTGLDLSDLSAANGKLGALVSHDEGMTYSATFTPATGVSSASNVIALDLAGVADAMGNAGAATASSANYSVDTVVPEPVAPPVQVVRVDGMDVQKQTGTAGNGSATQIITVPTVSATRVDEDGNAMLADIPLVVDNQGRTVLEIGVSTGFGVQASGASGAQAAGNSLGALIDAIRSHTQSGSQAQSAILGGASGFAGALDSSAPLLVQTILALAPSAPDGTLSINGAPQESGLPRAALVIDGSALPSGTQVTLSNVDFAAVIGNLRVTGGEGAQTVYGDSRSQYIMLGAGDDELHGGAGNDTVGSGAGNDRIFGDEGDDIVFGGLGNDIIDGGSGRDIVQLAGASRDDYILRVSGGKLVMTQRNGGADGTDIVSNVETLRFTGAAGPVDLDFGTTDVASLVRLYATAFGRNADEAGLNFWIAQSEGGVALQAIAKAMMGSQEAQGRYAAMDNQAYVQSLYATLNRSGSAQEVKLWADLLDSGAVSRDGALLGFADSAEKIALVGVIDTSIDTI